MSTKELRTAVEEAITYCAGHADSEEESDLIAWMGQHITDAMERGPRISYDTQTPIGTARRVKIGEARRHFDRGGKVLVDTYGDDEIQNVYPITVTHSRETTSWEGLRAEVREWRNRYPGQRFYVITDEVQGNYA